MILLIFSGSLPGCSGPLSPPEYLAWASDEANGLIKSKTVNGIRFDLQFKSSDYVIAKEYRGRPIPLEVHKKRMDELEGMHYFDLRIIPPKGQGSIMEYGLSHPSESQARISYFSFGMKENLFLETSSGRIPCRLYHFERSFDLAPHRTFVLGFPKKSEDSGSLTLILDSPEFNTGPLKFHFSEKILSALPQIATE